MAMRAEIACALLALAACGCSPRDGTVSEREAGERTSRLYQTAMADLQAGRVDEAIAGFEKVLRNEPRSFSAHFQLAAVLQDMKHDYIGAMTHFREYLELQPDADKAPLARDRIKICQRHFIAQYVKEKGADEAEKELLAEKERLTSEVKRLVEENAKLADELAAAKKDAKGLSEEVASLSKMVEGIGGGSSDTRERPRSVIPTDAQLLDDDDETDAPAPLVKDRIAGSGDVGGLRLELPPDVADDESSPLRPARPSARKGGTNDAPSGIEAVFGSRGRKERKGPDRPATYKVQPGDTLYRISERFYGSASHWRKIREANKALISTDGRLQAGKEIVLP